MQDYIEAPLYHNDTTIALQGVVDLKFNWGKDVKCIFNKKIVTYLHFMSIFNKRMCI